MVAQQRYCREKDIEELRCSFIFVLAAVEETTGNRVLPVRFEAATPSGSLSLKRDNLPCQASKWIPITEPWSNLEV